MKGLSRPLVIISTLKVKRLMTNAVIRIFDFTFSLIGLITTSPILLIVTILGYIDNGHPIFVQERVGKNQEPFTLIKFRTMSVDTKSVATHLADSSSITKLGAFLRKSKLDELPQLINVVKGDMSLVGPRPNLLNQEELIFERDSRGVYKVLPGVTGLSQIKEIDMSTPQLLAKTDKEMIDTMTVRKYFYLIAMTVLGKGRGDRVSY